MGGFAALLQRLNLPRNAAEVKLRMEEDGEDPQDSLGSGYGPAGEMEDC